MKARAKAVQASLLAPAANPLPAAANALQTSQEVLAARARAIEARLLETHARRHAHRTRPLPIADLIAAGRAWRVVCLGSTGYAIEDRQTGERVTFPGNGETDRLFAKFAGLHDRDAIDDLADNLRVWADQINSRTRV